MVWPHRVKFPYRRWIFLGAVAAAIVTSAAWPGQSVQARLAAPFMCLLAVGAGFVVGWLPPMFQAKLGWPSGRLVRGFCLLGFYFFIFGTLLCLVQLALYADELRQIGTPFGELIPFLPAGLGAAAGLHHVYSTLLSPNASLEPTRD